MVQKPPVFFILFCRNVSLWVTYAPSKTAASEFIVHRQALKIVTIKKEISFLNLRSDYMSIEKFHSSRLLVMSLVLALLPTQAWADSLSAANTSWIMTATALVLFMTLPGLALFYGGLVRSKNVLSVLMQCFAIACIASVVWFVAGYSIAFSEGGRSVSYTHLTLPTNREV